MSWDCSPPSSSHVCVDVPGEDQRSQSSSPSSSKSTPFTPHGPLGLRTPSAQPFTTRFASTSLSSGSVADGLAGIRESSGAFGWAPRSVNARAHARQRGRDERT